MSEILNKRIVLVLNRNWQAINITTPALAFCQMATDVATGLDIHGQDHMIPTRWKDWLLLPVRDEDNCHRSLQNQPPVIESKPATRVHEF